MSSTSLTLQIGGDISRLRAEINKANGLMNGFKTQLANVGAAMGVTFGAATVFQGLQYGFKVIKDFEKSMSEVRAITNATDAEFAALTNSAMELGRTTLFTAKQVSELQIAFGRLGFSNQEILDSTAATLQLAVATGEDLVKSADIAGSTLRSFNLDAKEMQRVVDVMAASFNKSALGLDNFGESMKYVAPVAAASNITLEETTAMLGVLADAGIRGSMAGTSLRKIISDVGGESGTLAEKLEKLAAKGLSGADAMDEVGRTAYASLLILTKHINKVNDATEAYQNASGEAEAMASLMSDNLSGDITKLSSAIDGLILQFRDGSGPIRDMVQALTELVNLVSSPASINAIKLFIAQLPGFREAKLIADLLRDPVAPTRATEPLGPEQHSNPLGMDNFAKFLIPAPTDKDIENTKNFAAEWDRMHSIFKEKNPWLQTKDKDKGAFLFETGAMAEMANAGANALRTLDGALQVNSNAWEIWWSGVQANSELAAAAMEKHRDNTMLMADVATTLGESIGDAFGQMILGQENMAASLVRVAQQVIEMYLKMSIAAMIKAAIEDPSMPFPFGKIAVAAAGIGVVKSLFSGLSSNMSGGGSGTSGTPGRRPSEMSMQIGGVIKGNDLHIMNRRTEYRKSWTG